MPKTNKIADEAAEVTLSDTETVSPSPVEPKQTSAKSAGARPAKVIAHDAVVGDGETDPVFYSKAKVPGPKENRKSLTVLHVQRRLTAEILNRTDLTGEMLERLDTLVGELAARETDHDRRFALALADGITQLSQRLARQQD